LYVEDLQRSCSFYREVLELASLFEDERLAAFDVGGRSVLLLFRRGSSRAESLLPGGNLPGHDGSGELHIAFSIEREDLPGWEARLAAHHISIEGRVKWPRGGQSIYFRDPDNHLLEFATPGVWQTY
jgi:catechol 2,3-dioxygenase-like lactoylglutathione lyase family enzyme